MNDKEFELWLLDTISEGGYSFKEISEYVTSRSLIHNKLAETLQKMAEDGLVVVFLLKGERREHLDPTAQMRALRNFDEIVGRESKSASEHYLEISDAGRIILADAGIVH